MIAFITVCSILFAAAHASLLAKHAQIIGRDITLDVSYDFLIIGGGTSGLTVADRLTENPNISVLVIEYGCLESQEPNAVPGLLNATPYLFNITSTPQRGLDNATFAVPAAAVVGGGTVVNGMLFDRGSAPDYDAWVELGNPGWGWEDLLPYFKKSENFTPAATELADEFGISWDNVAHGFSGSVQSSYPVFQYQSIKNFFRAWHSLGVQTPKDPGNGAAIGAFWGPSSLNPRNETRSDARTAHYDPVAGARPNYHLLTDHAVSKVNFLGRKATEVEFIDRRTSQRGTVNAKKEVILAAGAAHTPQVLQLSGVGPKTLLDNLGIPIIVDLPGVGQNFQDQPTLYASYNFTSDIVPNAGTLLSNTTYAEEQLALYYSKRQGAYTICRYSGNAVAFIPLPSVTQRYQSIIALARSYSPGAFYPPHTDHSIISGYKVQRDLILSLHASTATSVQETAFSSSTVIPLTLIKPLSRGTVLINSTDPLAAPLIDWGALTNPTDLEIMVAIVRQQRKLMATEAMMELGPLELTPGANLTSDDQLRAALKQQTQPTWSHLCSTCSMMKREYGGVVDPDLLVYGVQGLSVVDASIIPLIPATHTSATVYAVAEKAADIIKARHQL
ncbi:MAG: hypothetical protein FRX48_04959 [Lasallia pustulata]|uniref:Glucose-methanol-choline oxidoreductase N-terminal domain-containing protein n=1 Tax=Lasallia pustulata TaxID=136370 RepID=A0A5M8PQ47_9LECA|nr:MAG: hypothetical protein FRX48_04959 [Lasallia pustulata]